MDQLQTRTLTRGEPSVSSHAVDRPVGRARLAVIDTDTSFVQVLLNHVERLGWHASVYAGAPTMLELIDQRLSAAIIDPAVAGVDLFEYVEQIGRDAPELAIVVVSGAGSARDRVRALHLGADDWIAKPCHPEEVVARVEATLRRARRATSRLMTPPSTSGELEIDLARFQAHVGGRNVDFTRREFEVLRLLAAISGKVLTREEIYEQVWGYRMAHGDRSVDVFVRKVRQKLEKASPSWTYIHTHFGLGYRYEPEPRSA